MWFPALLFDDLQGKETVEGAAKDAAKTELAAAEDSTGISYLFTPDWTLLLSLDL